MDGRNAHAERHHDDVEDGDEERERPREDDDGDGPVDAPALGAYAPLLLLLSDGGHVDRSSA